MTDAFILSGARTPVGKLLGVLKDFSAVDLGVIAARACVSVKDCGKAGGAIVTTIAVTRSWAHPFMASSLVGHREAG